MASLGYAPASSQTRAEVITASGVESTPEVALERIDALGQRRRKFSVLALTLPSAAGVDGVLGLDFLRGRRLTLDFRKGRISLT